MFMDRIIPRGGPILFVFKALSHITKQLNNQTTKPPTCKYSIS